jgi:uncharacterized protein YdeI (YjbR/CyaY-like superfamily)
VVRCLGIWLKLRKKGRGVDGLDYAQALDVALCYGWIDGQKDTFDDSCWLQRFAPRTPRSKWSKVNREKASALVEQGRMRAPGMAEVERAKADGRWDAAYAGLSRCWPSIRRSTPDRRNGGATIAFGLRAGILSLDLNGQLFPVA